jgi:hypothetical protein
MAKQPSKTGTERVVSPTQLVALLKESRSVKAEVGEITGSFGDRVKSAVENANLHSGAFKLTAKLHAMEEQKREAFLRHFGVYVDICREKGLFGAQHVGDLDEMARRESTHDDDDGEGGADGGGGGEAPNGGGDDPVKLADAARTAFAGGIKQLLTPEEKKAAHAAKERERRARLKEAAGTDATRGLEGADAPSGTRVN